MNPQQKEALSVAEQAATWLTVLETADEQQAAAFMEWMKASPLHVRELLLAGDLADVLRTVDPQRRIDAEAMLAGNQANVIAMGRSIAASSRDVRRGRFGRRTRIAASLAGTVLLATAGWLAYLHLQPAKAYSTDLGEQRVFELSDGSVVFLNAQSRLQVRYSERARDLYLRDGQALFRVRHDATRPFRVHAAAAVFQAIGTQFDVRLDSGRATIAVVEGAVQISTAGSGTNLRHSSGELEIASARIEAGEGTSVDVDGKIERSAKIDAEAISAWHQQRLVFRDKPLSEIAREFNRYNLVPRLSVEDEKVGGRLYNGSFAAHHPESFLNYIAQESDLMVERNGEHVVIRAR
jgi:transmembrane sensor